MIYTIRSDERREAASMPLLLPALLLFLRVRHLAFRLLFLGPDLPRARTGPSEDDATRLGVNLDLVVHRECLEKCDRASSIAAI